MATSRTLRGLADEAGVPDGCGSRSDHVTMLALPSIDASGRQRATQFVIGASRTPSRTSRVGCDLTPEKRFACIAARLVNATSNAATFHAQLALQP